MSYILPSTLSSYALVSLSKRRRGTPLLHHNNNNNNDNAYKQRRCSRTRLRAATRTHAPQQVHAYKQCVAWHVFFICFFCSFFFFSTSTVQNAKWPQRTWAKDAAPAADEGAGGRGGGRGGGSSSLGQLFANLRLWLLQVNVFFLFSNWVRVGWEKCESVRECAWVCVWVCGWWLGVLGHFAWTAATKLSRKSAKNASKYFSTCRRKGKEQKRGR